MDKPLYGTVTICLHADDVPGKAEYEQAEAKEWEFHRIRLRIRELLGHLVLEENWEWRLPVEEGSW